MPHYRKLVGEKCYLAVQPEGAAYWAKWENDPSRRHPLGGEAYRP